VAMRRPSPFACWEVSRTFANDRSAHTSYLQVQMQMQNGERVMSKRRLALVPFITSGLMLAGTAIASADHV
jgi:hypothetical protein